MNSIEVGYLKGECCNRDGCKGVIDEYASESSCSCHINPPCSHCTEARGYCPICNWQASEDVQEYNLSGSEPSDYGKKYSDHVSDIEQKRSGKQPISKFDYYSLSHTHFSMKKIGVFPSKSMSKKEVESHLLGSFGGRFSEFNEEVGTFTYIAYTD